MTGPALNPAEWSALAAARDRLLSAPRGCKAAVVADAAASLGCSVATLYRRLEQAGLETNRRQRSDAGASTMPEAELRLVSGVLLTARRENHKALLTVEDALDMLHASGQLRSRLSPGRVGSLLRAHNLHPDQLAQQRAAIQLRSLHPNHVWQIDSSTCVLYYVKSGHLAAMDSDTFYKNKPANLARVMNDLCTRYIVTDHTTGTFKGRYFLGGERAETVSEFLLWSVSKQDGVPMHGVPRVLMLDKGPGNTSHLLTNFARNLRIEQVIHHATGNARAVGSVEKTGDIWERHFEGRFRFFDPEDLSLERINALGCEWAAHYCTHRNHTRLGEPRYSAWMRITPEQLRVPASPEILRELVHSVPEQRRVGNDRTITYACKGIGQRRYDLSVIPGVVVGGKVNVCVNAYRAPAVDVQITDADTGAQTWQTVAPIEMDTAGFPIGAPIIGEKFRTASNTPVDEQRNLLRREAYRAGPDAALPTLLDAELARKRHAQAYSGVLDPMADVRAAPPPNYLPRRGTDLPTPARTVAPVVLTIVDACKRLKAELGEAYTPQVYTWLCEAHPQGVAEPELPALVERWRAPQREAAPALRLAGGNAA